MTIIVIAVIAFLTGTALTRHIDAQKIKKLSRSNTELIQSHKIALQKIHVASYVDGYQDGVGNEKYETAMDAMINHVFYKKN